MASGAKGGSQRAAAAGGMRVNSNGAGGGLVFQRNIGGQGGPGVQGGFIGGTVIARDGQSVTVKLQDGGSKIVFIGGSTQVAKTVSGSLADLAVGTNVMVTGSANPDGSVTAQSVQIRPVRMATSSPAVR